MQETPSQCKRRIPGDQKGRRPLAVLPATPRESRPDIHYIQE